MHKRISYISLKTIGAATVITLLLATTAHAQTADHLRLRIVIRSGAGSGIAGLSIEAQQVQVDQTTRPIATAITDQRGIVDFQIASWQVGTYMFIVASGTSGYPVISRESQLATYTPTGIRLTKSGDEWVMLVLRADGSLAKDVSYDLNVKPKLPNSNQPTPRPLSWAQLLLKRGLPVNLPLAYAPTPKPLDAAQPSYPAANQSGQIVNQSTSPPLVWLGAAMTIVGYLLWKYKRGVKRSVRPAPKAANSSDEPPTN